MEIYTNEMPGGGVVGDDDPEGEEALAKILEHLEDPTDAHDASAISSVPVGSISSTNVQGALTELDADNAAQNTSINNRVLRTGDTMTGTLTAPDVNVNNNLGVTSRIALGGWDAYNVHRFNVFDAGIGGLPATSGSTDVGIIARFNQGNVVLDFGNSHAGFYCSWIQSRQGAQIQNVGSLLLNPNGGGVGINIRSAPTAGCALTVNGEIHSIGPVSIPPNPAAHQAVRKDYIDYIYNTLATADTLKVAKAGDSMSGRLNMGFQAGALTGGATGQMEFTSNIGYPVGGRFAGFALHIGGYYAAQVGIDPDAGDANLRIGGWSMGATSHVIWHEGLAQYWIKAGGARLLADTSAADTNTRFAFKCSVPNTNSVFAVMPNGAGTVSAVRLFSNDNPSGAAGAQATLSMGTVINGAVLGTYSVNGGAVSGVYMHPGGVARASFNPTESEAGPGVNIAGGIIANRYTERIGTWVGTTPNSTQNVDWNAGPAFIAPNGTVTVTFTNSGGANAMYHFLMIEIAGNFNSVVWPASVVWSGGVKPSIAGSALCSFVSRDGAYHFATVMWRQV